MSTAQETVIDGFVGTDQTRTYLHLPFTVPEHTGRIDVQYEYSDTIGSDPQLTGGNTVDIGIFDPRGTGFHSPGFRGWSGSARQRFSIATDSATPGYIQGPIQPGTWSICLGLYKVAPEGCDYKVSIQLTPAEDMAGTVGFPAFLTLSDEPVQSARNDGGWYKGELHCHTHHSDGDSAPIDVVKQAEALGLDFLAIMDHNTISHQIALNQIETPLILIPGYEVTTFNGHWNIWGDQNWIDFRILTAEHMDSAIQEAVKRCFLVSCNHPRQYGPPWAFEEVEGFHCIEVWNGPWPLLNEECLAFWETKLRAGKRFSAVGGSDNHFFKRDHHATLGTPTTCVYCEGEPSAAALLDALRAGHAYITESPQGPDLYLQVGNAMMGDTIAPESSEVTVSVCARKASEDMALEICGANGVFHRLPVTDSRFERLLAVNIHDTPYIRAQLASGDDTNRRIHALTNPVYVQHNA